MDNDNDNQEWHGRERRAGDDRRQGHDRREEIRFEPGKKDRRKTQGRRAEDRDLWRESLDGFDS
jgi:hypothetical protein